MNKHDFEFFNWGRNCKILELDIITASNLILSYVDKFPPSFITGFMSDVTNGKLIEIDFSNIDMERVR